MRLTKELLHGYNVLNAKKGSSTLDVQQAENRWVMRIGALTDESVLEWNQSFPAATVIRNEEV